MNTILFDNPNTLIIIALIIETILFLAITFTGKLSKLYLIIGPAIIGLALLCDYMVETNREQLERITRTLIQAAEDEDLDTIVSFMDDGLILDNGFDKTQTISALKSRLKGDIIASNTITKLEVTKEDDTDGRVDFSVLTTFDPKSQLSTVPIIKSRWTFVYFKYPEKEFKAKNFRINEINGEKNVDPFKLYWN